MLVATSVNIKEMSFVNTGRRSLRMPTREYHIVRVPAQEFLEEKTERYSSSIGTTVVGLYIEEEEEQ